MPAPSSLAEIARVPALPSAARRLWAQALDAIFPPRCAACGRSGTLLCAACQSQVLPVPQPVCRRCGRPEAPGPFCSDCQGNTFHVSAIRAAGIYARPLSQVIQAFKYEGRRDLHLPLSGLMIAYWQARAVDTDLVAAVPLHEDKLQERGFNQSQLLAEALCRALNKPLIQPGPLRRVRKTRQQALLGLADRRQNVVGAFAWQGPTLEGQKVLLIDDVATSGSTLEACGEALRAAGAAKVWALTIARAIPPALRAGQPGRSRKD